MNKFRVWQQIGYLYSFKVSLNEIYINYKGGKYNFYRGEAWKTPLQSNDQSKHQWWDQWKLCAPDGCKEKNTVSPLSIKCSCQNA